MAAEVMTRKFTRKTTRRQRRSKMDMTKYSGPAFLKVNDVRDGPLQRQIAVVNEGKYEKPDAVFETGETLSLNATNVKTLIRAYGPKSEEWTGKQIELTLGTVKFNGEPQDAVIVKPVSPPIATAKAAKSSEMDDEIPFE
jgi:hypothetical protein